VRVRRVVFERRHDSRGPCSWIGNLIWLLIGGWHLFLSWFFVGLCLCASIVFIPCGIQCIKIAIFLLFPFGKTLVSTGESDACCCCNCFLNILWAVTVGWILALQALFTGVICMLSIIGIPFGIQCFKLALLSFRPFGIDFSADEIVSFHTETVYSAA
jgi:uncharacterized membrane protein YccF (DUF307 family)